jgi:uroporphyrinogen decarboxylase
MYNVAGEPLKEDKVLERPVLKALRARYNPSREEETERLWAEEGQGLITSREELERFPWPRAEDFDLSIFDSAGSIMPSGMRAIASIGYVFSATWMLMGFEQFCMSLIEDEPLVSSVFQTVGEIQYGVFQALLDHEAVGAFLMSDDIAYTEATMVSPEYLRRYVFPWYRAMGEECAKRGLPFLYHSDGRLYDVMDDIIDCDFRALHPIEPKAMDIGLLKREYGDRLCLMGNIDLGYTLTLGNPDEVVAEVKERIRELAPGGGYCLGASNSVPEYVRFENYMAMRETALRHGRYPIAL